MTKRKGRAVKGNLPEIILWGETAKDFEGLRAALHEEWSPEGPTEEYEVETLTGLMWRRQRLDFYEKLKIRNRVIEVRQNNERSRFLEGLKSLSARFSAADSPEGVNELLGQLSPIQANAIRLNWPMTEGEASAGWGKQIASALSKLTIPKRHDEAGEFLAVVDAGEMFDRNLFRIERIDAAIGKSVKRLFQLKTMKQMYRQLQPKTITSKTIEAPAGQIEKTPSA